MSHKTLLRVLLTCGFCWMKQYRTIQKKKTCKIYNVGYEVVFFFPKFCIYTFHLPTFYSSFVHQNHPKVSPAQKKIK